MQQPCEILDKERDRNERSSQMAGRDSRYDTLSVVQEKVLEAIRAGQEATLNAVRETTEAYTSAIPKVPEWAEAFTSAMPRLPEWAEAYVPRFPDFSAVPSYERLIGFGEQVWDVQRQFNQDLYEALTPIGSSTFAAAKETVKAAKPAEDKVRAAGEHTPRSTSSTSSTKS
jgi:hypothetical protein